MAAPGAFPLDRTSVSESARTAVLSSLNSGAWSMFTSSEVESFESEFANYVGARHSVLVNSCTSAIHAALLAHDIQHNDLVGVPGYTYVGTCMPAVALGAKLVFVDIDPFTQSLSPDSLSQAFDQWQLKAVIQAHLFGKAAAAEEVAAVCRNHGAAYISDCAQLLGNSEITSRLCELGACCFSFGESKLLRMGEGGAIATNSAALAERVRLVRHEGEIWRNRGESRMQNWEPSPWDALYEIESVRVGLNYRPPAVLAALGSALLREMPQNTTKTRTNAECLLAGLHGESNLELPSEEMRTWWTFPVVLNDHNLRDTILAALLAEGIPVGVHFPRLMSDHQALREASANANEQLSGARLFADNHFVLPIFSSLNRQHMDLIVNAIHKTLAQNASVLSEMKLKSEKFLRTNRIAELCNGLFMYLR